MYILYTLYCTTCIDYASPIHAYICDAVLLHIHNNYI